MSRFRRLCQVQRGPAEKGSSLASLGPRPCQGPSVDKRPHQQKPEYPVQLYGSASLRPFQKMAMSTSWGSAQVEDVDSAHPSSHTQRVGTLEVGECWVSQATRRSAARTNNPKISVAQHNRSLSLKKATWLLLCSTWPLRDPGPGLHHLVTPHLEQVISVTRTGKRLQ